ncbi:hypothetical protein [Iningainema tapete]|uniref:Uncharacterized protein n=1 Tax=Iningainema tapete BLCC-T55 TaxID=2748662 RepID=A0A8J7C454_9CYAN|nr:hypothetical protein [Iningainema tapete]MBD2770969.1 hypothetical protein [Iningainema tapete BLCC-T55]
MINHSKILSNNATPIGICSLLISLGAAATSTVGYFDTRVSYCDGRSKPCTPVVTVEQDAVPHEYRKNEQILLGNGLGKTVAALGSMLASTVAIVSLSIAANNRENIDEENSLSSNEHRTRKLIQSDLQIQIAEIEAEAQAKLHRKLTYDATAEMYLDESPELVDDIAQIRIKAEQLAKEEEEREQQEIAEAQTSVLKGEATAIEIPSTTNKEHYLNIGNTALTKLGTLTQSTIVISTPGAGKTTTIGTAWGRMRQRLGASFHATVIVYKKRDAEAFQTIADEVYCFHENSKRAVETVLKFVDDMKARHEDSITKRLFIDDFLTIWAEIEALFNGKYLNTTTGEFTTKKTTDTVAVIDWLISQLNAVFLIGRQSNDALWICSHSPNVEALPFVKDKSSRIAANLIFLARQDPNNSNGNYEVIEANINNNHLISNDEKRKELKAVLPGLINLSQQTGEPIILTSHGASGGWELGLIGKNIREEYEQYRDEWESRCADSKTPAQGTKIVDFKPNRPDFNELLSAIVKSFSEKGATRISRIPSGCNRVRTAIAEFDDDRKKDILVYLVERLIQQGLAEVVGDKEAEQKVKEGKPTLTTDHEFLIITQ